jgi:hypothetical protein
MRAKATPRAALEIPRAGDSPHVASSLQPSCVSCVLLGKRAAEASRTRLQRAGEHSILLPRAPPTRHQGAAEQFTKAATVDPKGAPKAAELREIPQLSAFRESNRRTPSVKQRRPAARGASHRNHGCLALCSRRGAAVRFRRRDRRAARPCATASQLLAGRAPKLRTPCRPAMRGCSRVAAILTVASAPTTPATVSSAPPNFAAPRVPGNAVPFLGKSPGHLRAGSRLIAPAAARARARSRARPWARRSGTASRAVPGCCAAC